MKAEKIITTIAITGLLILGALSTHAQMTGPPPPPNNSGPIDSGAIILLAGAAYFGYRHLNRNSEKKA